MLIWIVVVLLTMAMGAGMLAGMHPLASRFLREHDLVVALSVLAMTVAVGRWTVLGDSRLLALLSERPRLVIGVLAGIVFALGWVGSSVVFGRFALSLDEFWALADGQIFARGVPMARLPQEWLDYAPALQPTFTRLLERDGLWVSSYLPVNALLQWAAGPLASPLLSAGSVILAALIARRLFPQQPYAPVIAAGLLATSSQLIITAMTPYAMSGHLFFNLAWLWLFIQRRWWAYGLSLLVAALAMGLHQAAFFPLFALPFLLERFMAGQRVFAPLYVLFIAAVFLAWSNYDLFIYGWFDAAPQGQAPSGSGWLLGKLFDRLAQTGLQSVALSGANWLRFAVWQNPLVLPLVLIAGWPIARLAAGTPREIRAMLLGLVGTALFMALVIPIQGHGWGYRYLHGTLGSAALIATFALLHLLQGEHSRRWRGLALGMTAVAMVLIPVRAWQAQHFAAPYVRAHAAIAAWQGVDVVIVDAPRFAYSSDLVRNDPWLESPVKRMDASALSAEQFAQLCSRYRVRIFSDADAEQYGIAANYTPPDHPPLYRASFPDECPNYAQR